MYFRYNDLSEIDILNFIYFHVTKLISFKSFRKKVSKATQFLDTIFMDCMDNNESIL